MPFQRKLREAIWQMHPSIRHYSAFIIFIDHCQVNWVGKGLSYWHAKSWDCLLTHCLPMKNILFLIETIQQYQFRCNYLWNKTLSESAQALLKSASQHLYHTHWPLPGQLSRKRSILLTCKILGLLVNTLPGDGEYPVLNRDN